MADARLDELWTRWQAGGALTAAEEQELTNALADGPARDELFADQRLEGTLLTLGRVAAEDGAFARGVAARIAAERDGQRFVSSVERRIERSVHRRRLGWLLLPVAAAALFVALRPQAPRPAPPVTDESAEPAPAPSADHPRPSVAVARLVRAHGALLIDGARRIEASDGAAVLHGWGVVTPGGDDRAQLAFPDGTTLDLGPGSALLQIGEARAFGRGKEAFLARGRLTAEVAHQPSPMLLGTPQATATVVGTRFTLAVDPRTTRLEVAQGTVELAPLKGGTPARVGANQFALVTPETRAVQIRARGVALLIVGSPALQFDDAAIKRRVESLGFDVRVRGSGPPDSQELRDTEVILVSSSVFSLDLNTQYRDVAVPVVVWEPALFDDFGMTGPEENGACGVTNGSGDLAIAAPGHPLAAGLDGNVPVITGNRGHRLWMNYGTTGPAAAVVGTWPGNPARAVLFGYERGAAMPGLAAAPARRVGFFFYDEGGLHLTEAGWTLFDAAVSWAAGRQGSDVAPGR